MKIIENCWHKEVKGSSMYQIVMKLKGVKEALQEFNKIEFSHIQVADAEAFDRMDKSQSALQMNPLNCTLIEEEKKNRELYRQIHTAYITFLQQKTKADWGREGDLNSALYHSSLKTRRRHNRILSVLTQNGKRVDDPRSIKDVFLEFYQNHLNQKITGRLKVQKNIVNRGSILNEDRMHILEGK